MRTFKRIDGSIWAYETDGSQDDLIKSEIESESLEIFQELSLPINPRIFEIKLRLSIIDSKESIRPLRAIYVGTDTPEDHAKLAELENEAILLRAELENLK